MKNIKGKVTALIIIILAAVLNVGFLMFFQLSLQEEQGFVHSAHIIDTKSAGLTFALASLFWLLFIGNYWGFLTGELPTEKKLIYQKGIGSLVIFLGTAISACAFIRWGIINNLTLGETLSTLSLALSAFGILWLLIVKFVWLGWQEKEEKIKKKEESKRALKILLVIAALAIAFALEILFIYIGKGSLFNPYPAVVGATIIAPNLDFLLWAIFFVLLASVIIEKISKTAKFKAITIALWTAIIAYFIFYILKFYTFLEPGAVSALLSSWCIFGLQFTIDARAHLKD
jgi:hypothetical protein